MRFPFPGPKSKVGARGSNRAYREIIAQFAERGPTLSGEV
jgi:hypothetical protein